MRALSTFLVAAGLVAATSAFGATVILENRTPDRLTLKSGNSSVCEAAPGAKCSGTIEPGLQLLSAVADDKRSLDLNVAVPKGSFIWRVRYLNPAPEYHVQAGTFRVRKNASRLKVKLAKYGSSKVQRVWLKGKRYWRVRVGPISDKAEGEAILKKVVAMGFRDAVLFRY